MSSVIVGSRCMTASSSNDEPSPDGLFHRLRGWPPLGAGSTVQGPCLTGHHAGHRAACGQLCSPCCPGRNSSITAAPVPRNRGVDPDRLPTRPRHRTTRKVPCRRRPRRCPRRRLLGQFARGHQGGPAARGGRRCVVPPTRPAHFVRPPRPPPTPPPAPPPPL